MRDNETTMQGNLPAVLSAGPNVNLLIGSTKQSSLLSSLKATKLSLDISDSSGSQNPKRKEMRIAFRFVMCIAGVLFLALVVLVSFVVGGLMAEQNCYARYYSDRQNDVRKAIDDIGVSSSIGIERDSIGRVVLVGFVDSEDELNRIQVSVTPVLGTRDAKHAMASVIIGKTLSGFGQSR